MTTKRSPKLVAGWREWVEFPELCAIPMKAKLDTGARTSALHAFDLEIIDRDGKPFATFELHPHQRSAADAVVVDHEVRSFRRVRSSNGRSELRPVILTPCVLGDLQSDIELTLTSRDEMGFRVLLGRSAIRDHFLVDPGRSYVLSPELEELHSIGGPRSTRRERPSSGRRRSR